MPKQSMSLNTDAVITALYSWYEDGTRKGSPNTGEAWQHLSKTSVGSFRRDGERYLKDKSELSTNTIEYADWSAVYNHFYRVKETTPVPIILRLSNVDTVRRDPDGSVNFIVDEKLRGVAMVHLSQADARWLRAQLQDMYARGELGEIDE